MITPLGMLLLKWVWTDRTEQQDTNGSFYLAWTSTEAEVWEWLYEFLHFGISAVNDWRLFTTKLFDQIFLIIFVISPGCCSGGIISCRNDLGKQNISTSDRVLGTPSNTKMQLVHKAVTWPCPWSPDVSFPVPELSLEDLFLPPLSAGDNTCLL